MPDTERYENLVIGSGEAGVASGVELIMGNARFIAPRTVEISLNEGGARTRIMWKRLGESLIRR
jgi:hypothetical protein